MTIADYLNRNLPDYYPTMYQDGYTPEQIYTAFRKKLFRELTEQQEDEAPNVNVVFKSEVKIRK